MKLNDKHLCAFANSNAPIDHEGYLMKRGELNKAYQKRWFILKGNLLFYFEKRGDKEPIGVIILEGCTIELSESLDAFAFQISFEGSGSRAYVLAAETQEIMEKWMKAVTCAGYDYMKLMVGELQRQVDELSAAEHYKITHVPNQTQQEITKQHNILRNSEARSSDLLVDLSCSIDDTTAVDKKQRRVNPFYNEENKFNTLDAFASLHFPTETPVNRNENDARDFVRMHEDFGKYIKLKERQNLK